jgi:hypothetical protein
MDRCRRATDSAGLVVSPDLPFILPLEIQLHYPLHRHVNIRMMGKKKGASNITSITNSSNIILTFLGQPYVFILLKTALG